MNSTRRTFIKQLGLHGLALVPLSYPIFSHAAMPPRTSESEFMRGVNAYYLLVEAYRHVVKNSGNDRRTMVRQYLVDRLCLPALQEQAGINSIRFWAFNDYPNLEGVALPGSTDGRLWKNRQQIEPLAFEVLGQVTEVLAEHGFSLVPVLANYWPSYGGILQYLVWAGELTEDDYREALCQDREAGLYLENTLRFFTSPTVEEIFRAHVGKVLSLCVDVSSVRIIEIMNEPRGKNSYSLQNKPVTDGVMSADLIARWLNRQADWIRGLLPPKNDSPYISSGEEGWLEHSPASGEFQALTDQAQYYEGIDLLKNVSLESGGITIGSVHMYTHLGVQAAAKTICGSPFVDRRGWDHLAKDRQRKDRQYYVTMSDEWLVSRARSLQGFPWYLGEMGWCRPIQGRVAGQEFRSAIMQERRSLYRHWLELAKQYGAQGVFLWMLDGVEHKDRFYGMSGQEVSSVMAGSS